MLENVEDPRKTGLKFGLRQLTNAELRRVLDYPHEMVLDEFNYHEGKFCPLAVALDLPATLPNPTNARVIAELEGRGYSVFNTRGLKGEFYTTQRKRDLLAATLEVLAERAEETV